jgi:hypothetical protein
LQPYAFNMAMALHCVHLSLTSQHHDCP